MCLFNIIPEIRARAISQLKEMRGYKFEKKKSKVSLFADDIMVHISDPRNFTVPKNSYS